MTISTSEPLYGPDPRDTRIAALEAEVERRDAEMAQVIDERESAEAALSRAHVALGGDGQWVTRTYQTEPGRSGDLRIDVPILAEQLRATLDAAGGNDGS